MRRAAASLSRTGHASCGPSWASWSKTLVTGWTSGRHTFGISRPTLVRLLEDGEIPYSMRGRHRRVLLNDVLAYREQARGERRQILDAMVNSGEEAGLYDATAEPRRTR